MNRQQLVMELREPMERLGFRKRSGAAFSLELTPGVLAVVGFNTAARHDGRGGIDVSPVVGVHHQSVEQEQARLRRTHTNGVTPLTIVRGIAT